MYESVEALAYELEAAGRRATGASRDTMTSAYQRGMAQLGGTAAGERLGEWVRSAGGVASQVPFLSWQADLVAARHGTDELVRQVKQLPVTDPRAGVVAIQLVEALDAVRRERLAIRAVTALANPMSVATSTLVMAAGRLGHVDQARPLLVRRAHTIAARQRGGVEERFVAAHVLARAYLAGGKPHHSLRFAVDAAQLARQAADESSDAVDRAPTARERLRAGAGTGVLGALTTARQVATDLLVPTYEHLPAAERWRRRCGAALVTAAWAHLALGQSDRAVDAASTAVRLGHSMGYTPQAAALPATGVSVRRRQDLLKLVEGVDRREYTGTRRGDSGTALNLTALQAKKAVGLVRRRKRRWPDTGPGRSTKVQTGE